MSAISIYAELLLNIRQITIQVSLPSSCNEATSIGLSKEHDSLSVFHGGQAADIHLPTVVQDGFDPKIHPRNDRELLLRLPAAVGDVNKLRPIDAGPAPKPLWSAPSMTPDTRIACRACRALLVKDSIRIWKDLPSENWAEMMDFWHCHKPDTEDSLPHHQNGLCKGYSAANCIEPTAGVGLLDTMHILLFYTDVNGILDKKTVTLKVSFGSCFLGRIHVIMIAINCYRGKKKEPCLNLMRTNDSAADTIARYQSLIRALSSVYPLHSHVFGLPCKATFSTLLNFIMVSPELRFP